MHNSSTPDVAASSMTGTGPLPYLRFLDPDENAAAWALLAELKPGKQYPGVVQVSHGAGVFSGWRCLEVRDIHKPNQNLVVVLPAQNAQQSETRSVGFSVVVTTATSPNRKIDHDQRPLQDLAKEARGGIERLLDALGWPAEEVAFHRAIDRLLQVEEDSNPRRS